MNRETRDIVPYMVELSGVIALYACLLFARRPLMDLASNQVWHALVLMSPAIPVWGVFWVIWRHYRRLDEYGRHLFLNMIAICSGVAASLTSSYAFVKDAFGLPDISITYAWPVLGGCWFVAAMIASWRAAAMGRHAGA